MADANAFLPHFIADYNARFAKAPRSDHDAHRPVRDDENMELIFAWQEPRRLSKSLTVQYDKVLYLLTDTPHSRRLAGRYIQIVHYPDGRIEPRDGDTVLPCVPYDRLSEIDQGAIVDNKRLGHVLQVAQTVQVQRDSRRPPSPPGRPGDTKRLTSVPGQKSQRDLSPEDIAEALGMRRPPPRRCNGKRARGTEHAPID